MKIISYLVLEVFVLSLTFLLFGGCYRIDGDCKESPQDTRMVLCSCIMRNCNSPEQSKHYQYIELQTKLSISALSILSFKNSLYKSRNVSLLKPDADLDIAGIKPLNEQNMMDTLYWLAIFNSKNQLESLVGLSMKDYLFTIINGDTCLLKNNIIISKAKDNDFHIDLNQIKRNKKLFNKTIQMLRKKMDYKDDRWISDCYPELCHPVPKLDSKK